MAKTIKTSVNADNCAAVDAWLPSSLAMYAAVRDVLAVDRLTLLARAGELPKWCVPVLARLATVARRKAADAALVSGRLYVLAFGESVAG